MITKYINKLFGTKIKLPKKVEAGRKRSKKDAKDKTIYRSKG